MENEDEKHMSGRKDSVVPCEANYDPGRQIYKAVRYVPRSGIQS